MIARSGRRMPRRAGPWPGPPAPAESADADRALAELYQHAVRSQVALAFSALRAELPAVG